jgi:hypothetical protein
MKKQLEKIIKETDRKHISQVIKKDLNLLNEISKHYGNTISEKAYNFLNPGENICKNNKSKKFNSITKGYRFCGKASVCECARDSVSENVSKTKQSYSDSIKKKINQKRSQTVVSKYGVENVGQTAKAKLEHKKFYKDKNQVAAVNKKIKNTKFEKYGDKNYNNPIKIKQSLKETYSTDYLIEKYNNSGFETLKNADKLAELYRTKSVEQIAEQLGVHVQTIYKYLNINGIREPYKSSEETEIVSFLQSLGITNIVRNSRKLIPSKKEIDIYLPDYNTAIEYNGVYWHHEDVDHITRSYHSSKYYQCQEQGINLITVFSNFWKTKPDVVKNTIKNRLGINNEKIAARKCVVKQIKSKDTKELLEKYHIQGYTPASVCLGLYYNQELIAVMTFSKARIAIGKNKSGYELVRFASKVRVVGGAGKLLSYFLKNFGNEKIFSYSNNEWSNGDLYRSLGFDLAKEIPPSYWYLKPREEKLFHRFNFSKQKLIKMGYDGNLTERQITRQMGLMKIWDCGKKLWVYDKNS